MESKKSDIFFGLGFGLFLGCALGTLAASLFIQYKIGGDIDDASPFLVFGYLPDSLPLTEPFKTALFIGSVIIALSIALALALVLRQSNNLYGSARWATKSQVRSYDLSQPFGKVAGPIWAKLGSPRSSAAFVSSTDVTHSLVAAPTGAGKGVGIVIPTILTYFGSLFVLDVKGENFEKTSALRRNAGDKVIKFAPSADDLRSDCYNPLDELRDIEPHRVFTEARRLAGCILAMPSQSGQGFLNGACDLLAAGICAALETDQPNLAQVYDFLLVSGSSPEGCAILSENVQNEQARAVFARMAEMESRIFSSYLSVLAEAGLSIWNDPTVRSLTAKSTFTLRNFRREPTTLYFVINQGDVNRLAALVRLFCQQLLSVLQRSEPGKDEPYPVLFLLDEFSSLGKMDLLSTAITTLRSYGGRIMIILQSIAHLQNLYGHDGANHFLSNCELQLYMTPTDERTPEFLSKQLGNMTRKIRRRSWAANAGFLSGSSISESHEGFPLMRLEDIRRLDNEKVIILLAGRNPILARRVKYFEDRYLARMHRSQFDSHADELEPAPVISIPLHPWFENKPGSRFQSRAKNTQNNNYDINEISEDYLS